MYVSRPNQLYVRESIRMVNDFVLREGLPGAPLSVVRGIAPGNSSVGIGNWGIDVHQVQRVAARDFRDGHWRYSVHMPSIYLAHFFLSLSRVFSHSHSGFFKKKGAAADVAYVGVLEYVDACVHLSVWTLKCLER